MTQRDNDKTIAQRENQARITRGENPSSGRNSEIAVERPAEKDGAALETGEESDWDLYWENHVLPAREYEDGAGSEYVRPRTDEEEQSYRKMIRQDEYDELKYRGHSEEEIAAMFAKWDAEYEAEHNEPFIAAVKVSQPPKPTRSEYKPGTNTPAGVSETPKDKER